MKNSKNAHVQFTIVIYRGDDYWIAKCLELDLLSSGPDPQIVREDAINASLAQFVYALNHQILDSVIRTPDPALWAKLLRGQLAGKMDVKLNVIPLPKGVEIPHHHDGNKVEFRVYAEAA